VTAARDSDQTPAAGGAGAAGLPTPAAALPTEARAANLRLWNAWTGIHEVSAFYDVDGFKAGASSLMPLELEELGPYVGEGTTLLHLQCHFGLDTLSWARRGARVVGLDFSDEAVALARRLAAETGLDERAEFVCADVYDADRHLGERQFDVVFVSWGAIEWLPDLGPWATIVARHLRPGGSFYMAEIHPFACSLDEVPGKHDVQVGYSLLPAPDRPVVEPVQGSYADRDADTEGLVSYGWEHSFSEILGALTAAGLRLEHLHEFPMSPAPFWDWMVRDGRWWWLPAEDGGVRRDLPFSYSLRATRPGA
jgi:SAM-dependent methyltransferase